VETGFDILDKITGGYQDGQLISIVAVPKTGKSTLALYSALHVRSVGRRAMFFTFEMSAAEQEDRLVSMVSGVDYNAILDGTITQREIDIISREHQIRQYSHEGLTLVADTSSVTTVSAVQAKIRQYKPRVVFVDGAYLMDDEEGEAKGSSQALTNITRALKRMAQAEGIPVILTTQGSQFRAKGEVQRHRRS
jgi:replicative DNA helicase